MQLLVGSMELSVRHVYHWRNTRQEDVLYEDLSLILERFYIPDLIRMNATMLELSYQVPIAYRIERSQ